MEKNTQKIIRRNSILTIWLLIMAFIFLMTFSDFPKHSPHWWGGLIAGLLCCLGGGICAGATLAKTHPL